MDDKKIYHAPAKCPVCSDRMKITKLKCDKCGTELNGEFSPCKFCELDEKYLNFIETFLMCKGSIKEVEKVMGISYPTVKNMLDSSLDALGLNAKKSKENSQREEILLELSNKKIDLDAAIEKLKELKEEKA